MPNSRIGGRRNLGTMIVYGFVPGDAAWDLGVAGKLGADCVEVLPDWRNLAAPGPLKEQVSDRGIRVNSVHGCWGSRAIKAARVDLSDLEPPRRRGSIDDIKHCADWSCQVGARYLVVHPGGLSDSSELATRREALAASLEELADHVSGQGLVVCVENMPPGVHPGTEMAGLVSLIEELKRPELGLALDTGHANLSSTAAEQTRIAGSLLKTTHVHDNNGFSDTHEVPGLGTLDWEGWAESLEEIGYEGPIMLECIRKLRHEQERIGPELMALLERLTRQRGPTGGM